MEPTTLSATLSATVDAGALYKACRSQSTFAANRSSLPVLTSVLVDAVQEPDADADSVWLSVTTLDAWARVRVPATVDVPGSALVPVADLKKILQPSKKAGPIRLDADGTTLAVTIGETVLRLYGLETDEFPALGGAGVPERVGRIDSNILMGWKRELLPFVSTEDSRPILNHVNLEYDHESAELTAVATNGHRLLADVTGLENAPAPFAVLVAPDVWKHTVRVWNKKTGPADLYVTFTLDKHGPVPTAVEFRTPDTIIGARAPEGPYPNWRAVVPNADPVTVALGVPVDRFRTAIARVLPLASDQTHRGTFDVNGDIRLAVESPDKGTAEARIPATTDGDPLRIGFNLRYLDGVLSTFGETVDIRFHGPERAAMLENGGARRALLMPLRLLD